MVWYGFGRMLIEGLRTDSLYIGVFRISRIVGFVCFVVGAILLVLGFMKAKRAALTKEAYAAAYPKLSHTAVAPEAKAAEETATIDEAEDNEDEEEQEEIADEEKEADISDKLKNLFDDDNN